MFGRILPVFCIVTLLHSLACGGEPDTDPDGDGQPDAGKFGAFDDHPLVANPGGVEFSHFRAVLGVDPAIRRDTSSGTTEMTGSSRQTKVSVGFSADNSLVKGPKISASTNLERITSEQRQRTEEQTSGSGFQLGPTSGRIALIGRIRNPALTEQVWLTYAPFSICSVATSESIFSGILPGERYLPPATTSDVRIEITGLPAAKVEERIRNGEKLSVKFGAPIVQTHKEQDVFARMGPVYKKCAPVIVASEISRQVNYVAVRDGDGAAITVGEAAKILGISDADYACSHTKDEPLRVGEPVKFNRKKPSEPKAAPAVAFKLASRLHVRIDPDAGSTWRTGKDDINNSKDPHAAYLNSLIWTVRTKRHQERSNGQVRHVDRPEIWKSGNGIRIPAGYRLRIDQILDSRRAGRIRNYDLTIALLDQPFPTFRPLPNPDPNNFVPYAYLTMLPDYFHKTSGYPPYTGQIVDEFSFEDLMIRPRTMIPAANYDRYLFIFARRPGGVSGKFLP